MKKYSFKSLKDGSTSVYINGAVVCIIDKDTATQAGYKNSLKYCQSVFSYNL